MRILGIDPGSRLTGYGCIEITNRQIRHLTHGTLNVAPMTNQVAPPVAARLLLIHEGLSSVIEQFKPNAMVIEKIFVAKNVVSALKLGQARGAALLTGQIHSLAIFEYSPTEVKQIVAGHGRADKEEVAKMVQLIVGRQIFMTTDASDGLALAICHAYSFALQGGRRAQTDLTPPKKKKMTMAEALGLGVEIGAAPRRTKFGGGL